MRTLFSEADGRKVVAADSAEDIGEVKHLIVATAASRVEALHIAGRGRHAEIVDWDDLQAFGGDAVIVKKAEATKEVSGEHDKQAVKGKVTLRGSRLLNTDGFETGSVEDVAFDSETGQIIAVITSDGEIAVDRLRSFGSYAVVFDV